MREYISSRNNEKIKTVRKLADKKYRQVYGQFIIEGHKLVGEYIKSVGCPLKIFVTETAAQKYIGLLESVVHAEQYILPEELYEHISTEKAPQGLLAVCPIPEEQNIILDGNAIILESVRDVGNLGTVIRSAVAFGIKNVVLSADCADLYNPKTLRATMGALFCINVCVSNDLEKTVSELQKLGRRVFAAMPSGDAVDIRRLDLRSDDCILVGNEGHGISASLAAACNGCVTIPMNPEAESLNASVAASVLMWELVRSDKDV